MKPPGSRRSGCSRPARPTRRTTSASTVRHPVATGRTPSRPRGGISVVVPVLNEAATIGAIVRYALRAEGVREVIVIDDGSIDASASIAREAGARVVTSTLLGKGASMEDGLRAARHETIVYLDGDLSGLGDRVIERLAAPVLARRADFVKGSFSRSGGRVTALTARPLLHAFFPELDRIDQPLGGLIAVRRSLLRGVRFETDYGVDVGLLIDAVTAGARVEQVAMGHIAHDSQPLDVLTDMASQVARVILDRASRHGRLHAGHLREVEEVHRHAQVELSRIVDHLGGTPRLALFAIDGVLIRGSFLRHLSRLARRVASYEAMEDRRASSPAARIQVTASAFEGVERKLFLRAAREIPLAVGAAETVVSLRRAGFRVGIISGGSRLVAEVIRRRVFADFSVGNLLRFRKERATGEITWAPAMRHPRGCRTHPACTGNVVLHLRDRLRVKREDVIVVGHLDDHACLLLNAGRSIAFSPASPRIRRLAHDVIERRGLTELLAVLELAAP